MGKVRRLDIDDVLTAIHRKDRDFYSGLSEEEKKEFSPFLTLRWLSATPGDHSLHYLISCNEIANVRMDELRHYPELQYRLMTVCGVGRRQGKGYIKAARPSSSPSRVLDFLSRYHPRANDCELNLILSKMDRHEFNDLVEQSGLPERDAKAIKTAYSKHYPKE